MICWKLQTPPASPSWSELLPGSNVRSERNIITCGWINVLSKEETFLIKHTATDYSGCGREWVSEWVMGFEGVCRGLKPPVSEASLWRLNSDFLLFIVIRIYTYASFLYRLFLYSRKRFVWIICNVYVNLFFHFLRIYDP